MPVAETFRCRCGAWVLPEQVLERGVVAVRQTPAFVYLRYRCETCQDIREKLVACPEPDTGGAEPADPVPVEPALQPPDLGGPEEVLGPIGREEADRFTRYVGQVTGADFARLRRSRNT